MSRKRLRPYIYWDVDFVEQVGDEFLAKCPFCLHNDVRTGKGHFYVNYQSGAFNCKSCGKDGSWKTFLELIYKKHLARTTEEHLLKLTKAKGIPLPILEQAKIAYTRNRYLFPVWDYDKEITDLRVLRIGRKEISTGGASVGLYGLEDLQDIKRLNEPVYLCEAALDKLSLQWLLWRTEKKGIVLSAPGANTFKDEWIHTNLFDNRDLIICYDNDDAGYGYLDETNFKAEGSRKVEDKLRNSTKSINFIIWPESLRKGYDVRDFINDNKGKESPIRIFDKFRNMVFSYHKYDEQSKNISKGRNEENGKPVRFAEIITEVKKLEIKVNDNFIDATKIALATAISVKIPGDSPVWIFLTGPSGIGKSLILGMSKGCKQVIWESTLSRTGLVSGLGIGKTSLDFSILNRVNNKCLVLQDFTTVLGQTESDQKIIFSLLREAYNGSANWTFGNGRRVYRCNFSFVAGVTGAIDLSNQTDVGERFLKYRIRAEGLDIEAIQAAALNYEFKQKEAANLKSLVNDFLCYPYEFAEENLIGMIPNWFRQKIIPLARFTANLRSKVVKHEKGLKYRSIAYKPEKEMPNRITVQFQKLGLALAFVDDKKQIDEKIYKLIYQVALDTANGFPLDIIQALLKEKRLSIKGIQQLTEIDEPDLYLDDMKRLGLIESDKRTYSLTKFIKDLWQRSQL